MTYNEVRLNPTSYTFICKLCKKKNKLSASLESAVIQCDFCDWKGGYIVGRGFK